jgi:hypothetical protein
MSKQCKERVYGDWGRSHQCSRKAVKDGYCKQHHPDTVKARREKSEARAAEKEKQSLWYRLKIAQQRITELEAEVKKLKGE